MVCTALVPALVSYCLAALDWLLLARLLIQGGVVCSMVYLLSRFLVLFSGPLGWRSWLPLLLRVFVLWRVHWSFMLVGGFGGYILSAGQMVFSLWLQRARSSLCIVQEGAMYVNYPVVCHRRFASIA